MAFIDPSKSFFAFDATVGGTLVAITTYLTEIDGLPGPRAVNEVTALSDKGAKFIPGLENVTITLAGIHDSTGTGPDDIFGLHRTGTATGSFKWAPNGSGTGTAYTGEAWVTDYRVTARVGNAVAFSVSLQVDGTITRGAA